MSTSQNEALTRGERLKKLRMIKAMTEERMRVLLREPKQMQQAICQFIRETPHTIPEIAAEIGKPTHEALWFVAALRKYGIVVEAGMCGDYPLYQRSKEMGA